MSLLQLDCAPSQQLALGLVAARHMSPPAPPPRRGESMRLDDPRARSAQLQEAGSSSGQGGQSQIANSLGITGASCGHRVPVSMRSMLMFVAWVSCQFGVRVADAL